jgi:dihydropteroate synthase
MIREIDCNGIKLRLGERTLIMGILNLTPDSFSGDGIYENVEFATEVAEEMWENGADIIDIGGESTRPGAEPVTLEEELKRVIPVIKNLRKKIKIPISIDTYKAKVAEEAILQGANIVNDISGLGFDPGMKEVVSKYKIPVVIMHIKGTPKNMQLNPEYKDVVKEIIEYFKNRIELAKSCGIEEEKIIIDPGIGFGKTLEHNLEILRRLSEFKILNKPILVGTSRKSFIGKILNLPENERLEGTAATVAISIANGADIVRVHDVKEMKRVAKITDAILKKSPDYL